MTPRALLDFLRSHRLAVQASVSETVAPQAAVVGFAISNQFEIVFDTLASTRKAQNLRKNPKVALVIGGLLAGDERTAQYEGIADEPSGPELKQLKQVLQSLSRRTRPAELARPDLHSRAAHVDSIQRLQQRSTLDRGVRSRTT